MGHHAITENFRGCDFLFEQLGKTMVLRRPCGGQPFFCVGYFAAESLQLRPVGHCHREPLRSQSGAFYVRSALFV
jgi:hypothetical protein